MGAVCRAALRSSASTSKQSKTSETKDFSTMAGWLPNSGYGVVLKSKAPKDVEVTMDFSSSTNMRLTTTEGSKVGALQAKVPLPPGAVRLAAQLMPDPKAENMGVGYKFSWLTKG